MKAPIVWCLCPLKNLVHACCQCWLPSCCVVHVLRHINFPCVVCSFSKYWISGMQLEYRSYSYLYWHCQYCQSKAFPQCSASTRTVLITCRHATTLARTFAL